MNNKISKWYYNDKEIDSIEEMKVHEPKVWGFVYLLTLYDLENKKEVYKYIGKKNIYSVTSKTATKKEFESHPKSYFKRKKMSDGTTKYYRTVVKESDWKKYTSSNIFIKNNKDNFLIKREIIRFSTNDADLKYQEAKEIVCSCALEDDLFLNDGVSIRMFGKKIVD